MWRAGKVYGLQTGASHSARGQADGRNSGPCVSRNWGPASRSAEGDFDYPSNRDGDGVQAGGNRGAGTVCPRTENVFAYGRGADRKRRGGAATVVIPAAG